MVDHDVGGGARAAGQARAHRLAVVDEALVPRGALVRGGSLGVVVREPWVAEHVALRAAIADHEAPERAQRGVPDLARAPRDERVEIPRA